MIPVKSELFPMVFQKPNACSSIFAGVSYNSLVRLVEQNFCHGRLLLVNAITSERL